MAASMNRRRKDNDDTECEARACFDTNEWINMHRKKQGGSEPGGVSGVRGSQVSTRRPDCPQDIAQLGRSTWGFLHTMAANYPQKPTQQQQEDMKKFLELFGKFYPCEFCAKDYRNSIKQFEPQVHDQHSLSQWMCRQHNLVNVKLGKPEFDCSLVNQRWRDGWKDGSCD